MKKTAVVAAIVVIGAAAWGGTSWYTGQRVEQSIREQVQLLNAQPSFGTVQISSYERGVFSSTARYELTVDNLPLSLGLVQRGDKIAFVSKIEHGPFPWSRLLGARFAPVLAATHSQLENSGPASAWFAAAGNAQPVQERSDIHYDGNVDFTLQFAPLSVNQPELAFESSAGELAGRVSNDLSVVSFTGKLDTMRVKSHLSDAASPEPDSLTMQDIAFQADYRLGQFDIYLGEGKASIHKLSLDAVGEEGRPLNIVLNDYVITSHVSEDATHVSGNLEYGLGSVLIDNINLGSLQALLRFGHLDGQAVKGIMARYREIQPQLMAEVGSHPGSAEELPPLLDEFLDESLEALLPGQPKFGLDPLRWTLAGAESSLRLNAALQPTDDLDDLFETVSSLDAALVVSQPMVIELLKRLAQMPGPDGEATPEQAESAARLSFGLFKQMALATGYVIAENDNLVARLSYADGVVKLNGQQMPLKELLSGLPTQP